MIDQARNEQMLLDHAAAGRVPHGEWLSAMSVEANKIARDEAVAEIARRHRQLLDIFEKAK